MSKNLITKILIILSISLFLTSCGAINSVVETVTAPEKTEEDINNIEIHEECDENTVVKINRFLPGFYHDGNWYVPEKTRIILLDDIDYKEEIILREKVIKKQVESLNGCMLEGDVVEGSYYNTPYKARAITDKEDNVYLCDSNYWCTEMIVYDGVDRVPEIPVTKDVLDNLDKIILEDNTVITDFKEIKEDVYLPGTSMVSHAAAFYTKDNDKFFYIYKYYYIPTAPFISVIDIYLNKAYSIYLNDEDISTIKITHEKLDQYAEEYEKEIQEILEQAQKSPEDSQSQEDLNHE